MSDHRIYTGDELLNLPPDISKPLIDKLLWERDAVIIAGKEKSGKSVIAQQMAFSLSSGEPFLSEYESHESCVLYIQVEGKLGETQGRVNSMSEGVSWNPSLFNLFFCPGMEINTKLGLTAVMKIIDDKIVDGMPTPKVMIFDPLYMCVVGDLCQQVVASETCKALRTIADKYNCAVIIIHHEHRGLKDKVTGKSINEGDNGIFGSFVWKAFADHILMFKKTGQNTGLLTCDTSRSQEVVTKLELAFMGPSPLMFELKGDAFPFVMLVEKNLKKEEYVSMLDIKKITELSISSIQKAMTILKKQGKVVKRDSSHPSMWRLV